MSNRKSLKISNGSSIFTRESLRIRKKKKKKKIREQKIREGDRQFYPHRYYGIKNT